MPEIRPSELVPYGIRKQKSLRPELFKRKDFSFYGPRRRRKMFTDSFSALSTFDKAATVAFYLTVAIALIALVLGICVKKFRQENTEAYRKTLFSFGIGYAVALIGLLLFLKLDEYLEKGYIDLTTFVPVAVMVISAIVLAVVCYIISVFRPEKASVTVKVSAAILGAELAAVLITQTVRYYKDNPSVEAGGEAQLYIYTCLLIAAVISIATAVGKKRDVNKTRAISYAAICAALAFALSYIRFIELPLGGSVTLVSLLPLMLYSYMFGIRRGAVLGAIYGLLQFIQSPWFYHPIQFLLDYPIAFSAIGLAGLLKERKVLDGKKPLQFAAGAIIVVIIRYLAHVVSGIFVFGSGDPENYSAVGWSFMYNSFAFADMAIDIVAGCMLFASRNFLRLLDKGVKQ